MPIPPRTINKIVVLLLLLIGLPMAGFLLSGKPIGPYLEFPPHTRYVTHAPFSWLMFTIYACISLILIGGILVINFGNRVHHLPVREPTRQPFPWWGWLALIALGLCWTLAWTRFSWFSQWQEHTFTPLWVSFIVVINALTCRRLGSCLLLDHTGFFLSLFFWSALFWWYFEYLNRFVQNWHYIGIEEFTPAAYVLHSSIAFSTVLPAVLSLCEYLSSLPQMTLRQIKRPLHIPCRDSIAWLVILTTSFSLFGVSIWPDYLFPFLWVSPLLILVSLQILQHEQTVFSGLAEGHWQSVTIPALAALACGFFWEMWNYYSAAKWIYTIPFVQRYELFEMPLVGYTGYLPFGLECVVAIDFVSRLRGPGSRCPLPSVSTDRTQ
ncbi:MAG: hypothetical protein ACE5GZ_14075 [Gammaproteobacteria bacterium]